MKTTTLTVRIEPETKAALAAVAHAERRSLANMLELIVMDCYNHHPVASRPTPKKASRK